LQRSQPMLASKEPAFICPSMGCRKVYTSYGSLYQHKRAHHPELVNRAPLAEASQPPADEAIVDDGAEGKAAVEREGLVCDVVGKRARIAEYHRQPSA